MARHRHPDSTFIDALGAKNLATHFSLTPQRLHMWRVRGVPKTARFAVAQLALVSGVAVPVDFLKELESADRADPERIAA